MGNIPQNAIITLKTFISSMLMHSNDFNLSTELLKSATYNVLMNKRVQSQIIFQSFIKRNMYSYSFRHVNIFLKNTFELHLKIGQTSSLFGSLRTPSPLPGSLPLAPIGAFGRPEDPGLLIKFPNLFLRVGINVFLIRKKIYENLLKQC